MTASEVVHLVATCVTGAVLVMSAVTKLVRRREWVQQATTFGAPAPVPPTRLLLPMMRTPAVALPIAPVPAAFVPMKLPSTSLLSLRSMLTPTKPLLPEMTLRAAALVPPI